MTTCEHGCGTDLLTDTDGSEPVDYELEGAQLRHAVERCRDALRAKLAAVEAERDRWKLSAENGDGAGKLVARQLIEEREAHGATQDALTAERAAHARTRGRCEAVTLALRTILDRRPTALTGDARFDNAILGAIWYLSAPGAKP